MRITFQYLVWGGAVPDWVRGKAYSREVAEQIMKDHINNVLGRYIKEYGNLNGWIINVVNEPLGDRYDNGGYYYQRSFGDDSYIDFAFQYGRNITPKSMLVYSDTYNHTPNGQNTKQTMRIVESLKNQGLVDAVGLHMHIKKGEKLDFNQPFGSSYIYNTHDLVY